MSRPRVLRKFFARPLPATTRRSAPRARRFSLEPLEQRALLTAYLVNTSADVVGVDGVVSLREAIEASSTNLAVGVCVGAAGVIGHVPSGVDWTVFWIGAAASVPGALVGARLTGRLGAAQLMRAIAVVLLIAGVSMLADAVVQAT